MQNSQQIFKLHSEYQPTGDQPQAIEKLVKGFQEGNQCETLLGVTGSGKTFTMANVIQQLNKPTLIIAHNKTLAAQLCTELRLDNICRNIRNHHRFTYDFHAILTDLIYARVLSPSSKLSSFSYCQSLLEPPKYSLQNLYRSLSVLAEESDYSQEDRYHNSNFVHPRNSKILYYDCTN